MPLMNVAWAPSFFWDGRAESLERQARDPVGDEIELGEDWDNVIAKLSRHPIYPDLFARAFETPEVTQDRVVKAISQFERTLISGNANMYIRHYYLSFPASKILGFFYFDTNSI